MKDKVNIMCIYWVGDFRGRDFTENDVWRLYHSVLKHCDRPFDFYVLTNKMDANVPGTKIQLSHPDDWPGWWSKVDLHRPDLPAGRTLYMDLDSHAIRGLGPILDTPGDLVMFRHRTNPNKYEWGVVHCYQAATMLFDPGAFAWLYEKFEQDWDYYLQHYRSEQDIMGEWIPDQPVFPDKWLMKMGQIEKGFRKNPPDDVIIITGQTKRGGFRKTHEIPWFEKMAREL